jgi:hypothetical protein
MTALDVAAACGNDLVLKLFDREEAEGGSAYEEVNDPYHPVGQFLEWIY